MTGKERAYLKKISHSLKPILIIGKEGVTENTIRQLDDALTKHELIKIKILNNNLDDRDEMIETILSGLKAEFVQYIGNKLTIYRDSEEHLIQFEK